MSFAFASNRCTVATSFEVSDSPVECLERDRAAWPLQIFSTPEQYQTGTDDVSAGTLLWQALHGFYVPWVVGYYIAVFVLMGDYLRSHHFQTLYDRVTSQGPASKALLTCFRLTGARHELAKRALYMATHLLFGVVTMSLAALHWRSFVAHSAFVFAICAASNRQDPRMWRE